MGKSSFNEEDHLALGMLGMHGTAYANFAVSECDLLITLGARFDDRVTGKLDEFACDAQVVHFDIDPAEINKNRSPQIAIIGDLRKILLQFLKKTIINFLKKKRSLLWLKRLYKWKEIYPLLSTSYKSKTLSPQETIYLVGKQNKNAFFTTDVGQHQMWSAQLINCQPKNGLQVLG